MSVSSNILTDNSRDLLREDEPCDDEIEFPINDEDEEFSLTNIRIVLVDSDLKSLSLMKNLMKQFSYQVTDFMNGDEAIAFLTTSKHEIDLVIWDFHVPEINGLDALNTIHKDMDLPVVIMSHEHKKETVMKSTKCGSCNFLVKPVSEHVVAVLWQHVYRKRISKHASYPLESDAEESVGLDLYHTNKDPKRSTTDEPSTSYSPHRENKKPRMTWTNDLHQMFKIAVEKMGGVEHAVPKQILKYMQEELGVQGLSRNNIASHLQKYRLNTGKKETEEDSDHWHNSGPNTTLTASNPLPDSSVSHHARRLSYFANLQAATNAPMQQYPSTNYITMNNNHFMTSSLANLPYNTDPFHQQQQQQFQQQQYSHSSLQLPSVITKQEPPYVSADLDNSDLISNLNSPFFEGSDFFPKGLSNFDTTNGRG